MTSRVCVDASLVLRWILPTQQEQAADTLLQTWDQAGVEMVGPPIFDAEITSVIRRHVYLKKLLPEQGELAYQLYREIGVSVVNTSELSEKAWNLAAAYNQTRTYDMQYLAVAELADCELWTGDRRFFNSVKDKTSRVHVIDDNRATSATRKPAELEKPPKLDDPGLWRRW